MDHQVIDSFMGDYRYLSNFHIVDVMYEGVCYPSTENAYQAAKTLDLEARKAFTTITPAEAKKLGKTVSLRDDWEEIKTIVMYNLCNQKFQQPDLKAALLATGDKPLIEGNWWGDTFWGVCKGRGKNVLGKTLMIIRKELRAG